MLGQAISSLLTLPTTDAILTAIRGLRDLPILRLDHSLDPTGPALGGEAS